MLNRNEITEAHVEIMSSIYLRTTEDGKTSAAGTSELIEALQEIPQDLRMTVLDRFEARMRTDDE